MLPRENRLFTDFDYRRLRRNGRRYGSPFFTFFVIFDSKTPSRFGFVVSAQVSRLAAKRNRIKRLLREEIQNLLPRIRPGTTGAFWVRAAGLAAEPEELRREVQQILIRAGVYH